MSKIVNTPNVYELGSRPEIDMVFLDQDGVFFVPNEVRLTIEDPTGTELTVSGGLNILSGDISVASGYLYYLYKPTIRGWHSYESWGKDAADREIVQSNGFDVTDTVIN